MYAGCEAGKKLSRKRKGFCWAGDCSGCSSLAGSWKSIGRTSEQVSLVRCIGWIFDGYLEKVLSSAPDPTSKLERDGHTKPTANRQFASTPTSARLAGSPQPSG